MTPNELALRLNTQAGSEGTTFNSTVTEHDALEVVCSNNDEVPVCAAMTETETQIPDADECVSP